MSLQPIGVRHRQTCWYSLHQQSVLRASPKSTASHSEREAGDNHGPKHRSLTPAFWCAGQGRSADAKDTLLARKLARWTALLLPIAGDLRPAPMGAPARSSAKLLEATTAPRVERNV